jgi:hypothetical protein
MLARILCPVLLSGFALAARAEVTLHEFEGYFVSEHAGTDPAAQFPASFAPGQFFQGWIVYDDERFLGDHEFGNAAPLVSVYLETDSGQTITGTNNGGSAAAGRAVLFESLSYSATAFHDDFIYLSGVPFHGSINFSWVSNELDQLPENFDPTTGLPPDGFRPNSWVLAVTVTPQCPEFSTCDELKVSTLSGHITRFGPRPPLTQTEHFDTTPSGWTNTGGAWTAENGYYRNLANVAFTHSIHTAGSELSSSYQVGGTLSSRWGASGNTMGLLLHYRDPANFDELRLNALGAVTYSRVTRGVRTVLGTGRYASQGPADVFSISVTRHEDNLRLFARGLDLNVNVGTLRGGRLGVFSSWNMARIYELSLTALQRWIVSHSDFGGDATGWTPVAGTWTPVNGYFYSSSNLPAAIALRAPFVQNEYTVDASVYLEWVNTGNQGGVVYDYKDASNYRAVVVSAGSRVNGGFVSGRIDVVEVVNGIRRVVLSRGGPTFGIFLVPPGRATTVGVRRIGDLTEVRVQGVSLPLVQPPVAGAKRAGLIARFNKVRFDDVVVATVP